MKRHINPTRIPIEEKESIRLLHNMEDSVPLSKPDPSKLIHIGDRENDIYEYFCRCQEIGTYFISRSCVNRLANESTIADVLAGETLPFNHEIEFVNATGKTIKTFLEVKFRKLTLHPPIGKQREYPDIIVTVVSAVEKTKPKDRAQIRWTFISNLPVETKSQAIQVLDWYKQRWKIEIYFKILKSGLKAEESKLRTADRLTRLISVFCILAWRIQWLTMLNREDAKIVPSIAFDDTEREIIRSYFKNVKVPIKTMNDHITAIARLGGYLARSSDPPPGNMVIWRGLTKLNDIRRGFELAKFVGN